MENDLENSSLRNCFICYLCGDFFRRPRILPCGHTFCSECLAKIRDEIVNEGNHDYTSVSSSTATGVRSDTSPQRNTLSPEGLIENGTPFKNHHEACNGKIKEFTHERKESSTCVDDMDNFYSQSYPPSAAMNHWCPSPKSASPVHCKNRDNSSEAKKYEKNVSPIKRNKQKVAKERNPSMFLTTQTSRPCSQCGSLVSPPSRDSSSLSKSTSMSLRDKSPSWSRDSSPRWDHSSPHRKSASNLQPPACSFEHKHGREMEPFVCPIPQCNYSMRVMNLARWSTKNKTLADALAAWKRLQSNLQESSTQTDISNSQSVLVTIPRSLVADTSSSSSSALMPLSRRKRHSSMIDIAIDQAVSMDGVQQPAYHPRGHYTWKSYAAMVGMNILQQILNL